MSDPTSAQMPSAIDAAPARSHTPAGQPPIPGKGNPAEPAHPFIPTCVRRGATPDRMKNTANSTRPISTTTPSVAVMTTSLANAQTSGVSRLKPGTKEGNPPKWIPFLPTAALVDRTSGPVPRPDGRSDLGGNALVEGEVADLIRSQLDPVRDVLTVPGLGDTGRSV